MLLRETLGISADGSEKMFRDDETTAFEQRKADPLVWIDRDHRLNVMHFFVAVDPSGGGASAFSICSCLTMPNGSIQVPPQKTTVGLELGTLLTASVQDAHRADGAHTNSTTQGVLDAGHCFSHIHLHLRLRW